MALALRLQRGGTPELNTDANHGGIDINLGSSTENQTDSERIDGQYYELTLDDSDLISNTGYKEYYFRTDDKDRDQRSRKIKWIFNLKDSNIVNIVPKKVEIVKNEEVTDSEKGILYATVQEEIPILEENGWKKATVTQSKARILAKEGTEGKHTYYKTFQLKDLKTELLKGIKLDFSKVRDTMTYGDHFPVEFLLYKSEAGVENGFPKVFVIYSIFGDYTNHVAHGGQNTVFVHDFKNENPIILKRIVSKNTHSYLDHGRNLLVYILFQDYVEGMEPVSEEEIWIKDVDKKYTSHYKEFDYKDDTVHYYTILKDTEAHDFLRKGVKLDLSKISPENKEKMRGKVFRVRVITEYLKYDNKTLDRKKDDNGDVMRWIIADWNRIVIAKEGSTIPENNDVKFDLNTSTEVVFSPSAENISVAEDADTTHTRRLYTIVPKGISVVSENGDEWIKDEDKEEEDFVQKYEWPKDENTERWYRDFEVEKAEDVKKELEKGIKLNLAGVKKNLSAADSIKVDFYMTMIHKDEWSNTFLSSAPPLTTFSVTGSLKADSIVDVPVNPQSPVIVPKDNEPKDNEPKDNEPKNNEPKDDGPVTPFVPPFIYTPEVVPPPVVLPATVDVVSDPEEALIVPEVPVEESLDIDGDVTPRGDADLDIDVLDDENPRGKANIKDKKKKDGVGKILAITGGLNNYFAQVLMVLAGLSLLLGFTLFIKKKEK